MDIIKELSALRARAAGTSIDFSRLAFAANQLAIQEELVHLRNRMPELQAVSIKRKLCTKDNGEQDMRLDAYILQMSQGDVITLQAKQEELLRGLPSFSLEDPESMSIVKALDLDTTDSNLSDEDTEKLAAMWQGLTALAMLSHSGSSVETYEIELSELYCIQSASEGDEDCATAFWSNRWGWAVAESATHFTYSDTLYMNLPIASGGDAQWTRWPDRSGA